MKMSRIQLKYCGNKSFADFQMTASSDADYLGVIFAESKRQVKPEQVLEWLTKVNIGSKKLVGVFVNASIEEVEHAASLLPLSVIQCHGTESVENVVEIKKRVKLPIWKVIHHQEFSLEVMKRFNGKVDGFIIDSKVKGMWGGSGQMFDWSFIPDYLAEATNQGVPCIIAGGINDRNLRDLLPLNPPGIDISSGIEKDGVKNTEIIRKIEEQVKNYESTTN